jgi:hypothetical protein
MNRFKTFLSAAGSDGSVQRRPQSNSSAAMAPGSEGAPEIRVVLRPAPEYQRLAELRPSEESSDAPGRGSFAPDRLHQRGGLSRTLGVLWARGHRRLRLSRP